MRKCLYGLLFALYGAIMITACGPIKEVPVKTEIIYRDSIKVETRIDTVTAWKTKIETVRDYTGLLDTLKLSTANAEASVWIDTTHNVLTGSLKDKDVPVEVSVPVTETIHYRDSLVYVDKPYPVEVTKEIRIVPKFWRVSGVVGILSVILLLVFLFFKIKDKFKI